MGPDAAPQSARRGRSALPARVPRAEVDDPRGTPGARRAPALDAGARGRSPGLPQHRHAGLRAAPRRGVRRHPGPRDHVRGERAAGAREAGVLSPAARPAGGGVRLRPAADAGPRAGVGGVGFQARRRPPRARVAYVTPCHQFPTGVIMPLERRLALLAWAARAGAWVIEDDYVSEFRYEGHPLEALQSLDRESRVIYVGTFSKTLFPALRVAYLVLPPALVPPFIAAKWATDRFSATLAQEVLAEFITTGQFERYLRRA